MLPSSGEVFRVGAADPGDMPDLLTHLWAAYTANLQEKIAARLAAGKTTISIDVAMQNTTATAFIKFARNYLDENRPVENFFVDANHGLRLTDNSLVLVSPPLDTRGTTQPAAAVSIIGSGRQADSPSVRAVSIMATEDDE